jgi:hypothetical protein
MAYLTSAVTRPVPPNTVLVRAELWHYYKISNGWYMKDRAQVHLLLIYQDWRLHVHSLEDKHFPPTAQMQYPAHGLAGQTRSYFLTYIFFYLILKTSQSFKTQTAEEKFSSFLSSQLDPAAEALRDLSFLRRNRGFM